MTVVTRFAPSPTGYLHIGGARTALFNWLFARHHGGKFLLRIEDTDRARSTPEATQAIFDGLSWLGLEWDGEAVSQFARRNRHAEMARKLLDLGYAYLCYATPEELEAMREQQRKSGLPIRYDGRWRDRDPAEAPQGVAPVVRLKAPQTGETILDDRVQGRVTVSNEQLDDMVLLRGDGTPTYMLSVVVDDHDFGVTHIIRGDDHLTNTFRQIQLYRALGWDVPVFAHIPLIHGPDGKKLSKRHGALGIEAYRAMGYLPEALRNYLLRLGWAHGDDEIISTEQAVAWFDLDGIGRSPARLDFTKMENLNGHYMRLADDRRLADLVLPSLEETRGRHITTEQRLRLERGMAGLKARAKTLVELVESARFYADERPIQLQPKAAQLMTPAALELLGKWAGKARTIEPFEAAPLEAAARTLAEEAQVKLGDIAQPLRAALTGGTVSPPVFEVAAILGKDEVLARVADRHAAGPSADPG
ncbi:MAG TPA: glutamate--tRNA ligase [Alphaproteobacteria bacterium]|nr:glutamate--tRNA ligase [Alphaproteobacteria bacterium]